ncbi:MAG: hypothetical protein CMH56_12215 [Myxococcales bacterium]|nr:hypothetical protein [Myxococcales bacterium]|tara:strand:+ start:1413 stop:2108 length:696 start_codon:yes stop_codon:yes gene_type:complete
MTNINSTTSSNVSNANLNNASNNVCSPDNPPATQTSAAPATGVTASQDQYEGLSNATGILSTTASALDLRNQGVTKLLEKTATNADDIAGTTKALGNYSKGLTVVGVAANTVNAGLNNNQTTTAGKTANVVLAGTVSAAATRLNPAVAALDVATGGEVSNTYNTGINASVGMVEAAITGDTSGVESLHQENLKGENGYVMKKAAEAGDFWADKGVTGGLKEFASELRDFIW